MRCKAGTRVGEYGVSRSLGMNSRAKLLRSVLYYRPKSCQISNEFRGLKISWRSDIVEETGELWSFRRGWHLVIRRAREAIKRGDESLRPTIQQLHWCIPCHDEF